MNLTLKALLIALAPCLVTLVTLGPALADDVPHVIEFVTPEYPAGAMKRNIEGYVIVSYNIRKNGTIKEAEIVTATPPGIFDAVTLDAVEKWRYAKTRRGADSVRMKLTFELQE